LDRKDIQDNPKVWWSEEVVQKIVKEYIKKWAIDAVRIFTPPPLRSPDLRITDQLSYKSAHFNGQTGTASFVAFPLTGHSQIITFDHGGVSGHINHRAVSVAIR
jgi:hypothetical protein